MLQAIYSSKLYRASTRKDKIEAAFDNPVNVELVNQLAKALDEEYQTPEHLLGEESTNTKDVDQTPTETTDVSMESDSEVDAPAVAPVHPTSSTASKMDSFESREGSEESDTTSEESIPESSVEPTETIDAEPAVDAAPSAVEESTVVKGTPIVGSLPRNIFKDMRQVGDEIKGMLNFKDSTCGVNRILCKENEFWIYYNDDVNLNTVMAEVIETLNAASYTYLEFNRLARSDNAIVFLMEFGSSQNVMKADPANQKK